MGQFTEYWLVLNTLIISSGENKNKTLNPQGNETCLRRFQKSQAARKGSVPLLMLNSV